MRRALPYLAAAGLPGAMAFAFYLVYGAEPVAAVIGGVLVGLFGLLGATAATAVKIWQARRSSFGFDEAQAALFLSQPRLSQDIAITDDGLSRLHADIEADELARRRDPKPPTRG